MYRLPDIQPINPPVIEPYLGYHHRKMAYFEELSSTANGTGVVDLELASYLESSGVASSVIDYVLNSVLAVSSTANAASTVALLMPYFLESTANATSETTMARVLLIADLAVASGAVEDLRTSVILATSAAVAAGSISLAEAKYLTDSANATEESTFWASTLLESTANSTSALDSYIGITVLLESDAVASDEISYTARIVQLLESSATAFASISIPDGEYLAWVMNTKTTGLSEYRNFAYNSMASVGQKFLGLTEGSLYELTGSDDDGTDIDASIKTRLHAFGTSKLKRNPRAYLAYTADGRLLLNTLVTDGGQKIERWYELTARTADAPREARVKLGRGIKALYWQYELKNIDGADFRIDGLRILPIVLKRRI